MVVTKEKIFFHFSVVFDEVLRLMGKSFEKTTLKQSKNNSQTKMEQKEKDFAKLVRDHKGTIYTVCYMFSNDNDEVNDLVQETLIHLWQGWDTFRGESEVNSWIYRVTLNTCISIDRKKKRREKTEAIVEGIDLFDESDTRNRQTAMLHERINKLQPFDRAIVLLWLENMSYDEIGAIVGISAKNVSVRLVRIKEQLKKV